MTTEHNVRMDDADYRIEKIVAEKIKQAVDGLGKRSEKKAAEFLDIPARNLNHYITGKRKPDYTSLFKIARKG